VSLRRRLWQAIAVGTLSVAIVLPGPRAGAADGVTSEQVRQAIEAGVRFLKARQQHDGSWGGGATAYSVGETSLVALALLSTGEDPAAPDMHAALEYLRSFAPEPLNNTYAIGLQTMVFAAAEPRHDRARILANVEWLERAQLKPAGDWTYNTGAFGFGDNSNSQYALLGLQAAGEAGINVGPRVLNFARNYYEITQLRDGGWGYNVRIKQASGSMTCAGLASLIITGARRYESLERLQGERIRDCGKGVVNFHVTRAIDWLASHFQVVQNFGHGLVWKYYYLYGLERAGRLTGTRFFGRYDWYRLGAQELVRTQIRQAGSWRGVGQEDEILATSFALLFLAKGRAPVLINKLRHFPTGDWDNDPDDVRNMVGIISQDWKHLLTWQVVDVELATLQDMLQAPIAFFNGHDEPVFGAPGKRNLREFVEQGGVILAEACCGSERFDRGFRRLIKEVFPEDQYPLRLLPADHPIWRARHVLNPHDYPLWGIEHGCRTVVIYSPHDLSCYWNQVERSPDRPGVDHAVAVGQNVIDYVTGRELPADKLAVRDLRGFRADAPKRGALRIAKLKHSGEWNIAPQAIPNLMETLRKPPLNFDVVITQKDLLPRDPNLIYYPLIYIHGRRELSFEKEDLDALRRHLEPGGGTLFADAACGSPAFDTAFRRFVAQLLPKNPLVPIPRTDPLFTTEVGFDLKNCEYTKAAGGATDFPQLEGIQLNGHWSVIYSKYDIGCALEGNTGIVCKGYTHESALRIAANIVIYSTLP
jgi:Domain of unknown function (DUF4159)